MKGAGSPPVHIPASVVGVSVGPREQTIDARWLMAYAAALGEEAPEYFDTTRTDGVLAHPLFPVCYEWPLALDVRANALPDQIAVRGVHATHRLVLHRAPRPGDRLSTTATVAALERRSPGAYMMLRMETVDSTGRPVSTTDYGSLYLGVDCDGERSEARPASANERSHIERSEPPGLAAANEGSHGERSEPPGPAAANEGSHGERSEPPGPAAANEGSHGERSEPDRKWSTEVAISPALAHVYTECARIWNPIHTDRAVALGAGLPDIILHGTATLALAISQALRHHPGGPAAPVRSIACRFGGMVRLPSRLTVRGRMSVDSRPGSTIRFDALAEDGRPAVRDGEIILDP